MTDYIYGLYAEYWHGDKLEKIFSTKEKAKEEMNKRLKNDCVDYYIKKIKVY